MLCLLSSTQILGQNSTEKKLLVDAIKDSIVLDTLDDNIFINKDKLSKSEINLVLIDGTIKKGFLKQLYPDSILLSRNGVLITSSVNDVINLNIIKKKDNRGSGALLGAILGAIPGIFVISQAKNRKTDPLTSIITFPIEYGFGLTLTAFGTVVGGVIGYNFTRGTTITIPINASKDLYKRQKNRIIELAY
jgi:hypothetical protein